jgi:hypothetical protein
MRPRTEVPPTLSVGAPSKAELNDVLINNLVSLTVGNRWRSAPWSQVAPGRAGVGAG